MLNPREVRDLVVRPVLAMLKLPCPLAAEKLIMGTGAQESGFEHIRQVGSGPALGLWQMEPATFDDLYYRYLRGKTALETAVRSLVPAIPTLAPVHQLSGNLYLAAAMCRVHYYSKPFALSGTESVKDLAAIWKRYYNTPLGAGTEEQFINNYRLYVEDLYG